jgi:tetratricopeptide (TPR) repeat protein
MAGIGIFLRSRAISETAPPSVAVSASKSASPQLSADLAHEIVLDLGRFQEGPLSGISIRQPDQNGSSKADYRIEVGLRKADNGGLHGDATMLDRTGGVLWTTIVDVAASKLADLHQQMSAKIGSVLGCSVRAPSLRPQPTGELLKLYLTGCASLYGSLGFPEDQTYNTFQRVTALQPNLADGWAALALMESDISPADPDYPQIRRQAISHLMRAKQLNPHIDLVYAAETRLHSFDMNYGAPIAALERAVIEHPDSALLNNDLAAAYMRVGRIRDGAEAARNAFVLNPLSDGALCSYIYALAFSGNLEAAKKELDEAERIWPGLETIETTRYYLNLRYADAAEASRVAAGNAELINPTAAQQALIAARLSPTEANKNRAIAAYEGAYRSHPGEIINLIQALGTFGRVDEAFAVLRTAPTDPLVANSETFFRPNMRSIRADARFIAEANRLGLTKVWKQTGRWPDFCSDPNLPYDCKKEAQKFTD